MSAFLRTKSGTAVLLLVFAGVLFAAAQQIYEKYQVDQQVKKLQSRVDQIRSSNQELSDLVNYLQTDQYKQKAAREQLDLKKDGEYVVSLPPEQQTNDQPQVSAAQVSIPKQWFNYFFRQ